MKRTNTAIISILCLLLASCHISAQEVPEEFILLQTDLKKGETLYLIVRADELDVEGATGDFANMSISEYVIDREGMPLRIRGKNISMFDCSNNQVTSLDATGAPALMSLVCNQNKIQYLILPKGDKLKMLGCANNRLSSLDLMGVTGLRNLSCHNNDLSSLNVKDCIALEALFIGHNKIEQVDVRDNVTLKELSCASNQLSALDLSKNEALQLIDCDSNKISEIDVTPCKSLRSLRCQANGIKRLDLTKNGSLSMLYCAGNQLTELDLTAQKELLTLNCALNQLLKLDLNSCPKLIELICYENNLEQLELGACGELSQLWCYGNKLTKIDATLHPNLSKLVCFANELTHLDIRPCSNLQELSCFLNKIEEIELYDNKLLVTLSCFSNRIKGDKMTQLVKGLCEQPEFFQSKLFVVSTKDADEQNVCLKGDVSIAKAKNWTVGDYDLSKDTYEDYEGTETALYTPLKVDCEVYPNPARDYILLRGAYGTEIVLYDFSGHIVRTGFATNIESRLDVSDLPRGIYLLVATGSVQTIILE